MTTASGSQNFNDGKDNKLFQHIVIGTIIGSIIGGFITSSFRGVMIGGFIGLVVIIYAASVKK